MSNWWRHIAALVMGLAVPAVAGLALHAQGRGAGASPASQPPPKTAAAQSYPAAQIEAGRGVFAAQYFQPGQPILTFGGPVLATSEMLALGPDRAYALQIGPGEFLHLTPPGRYVNHSCDPNCGLLDRVLIALRTIAPGEEIVYAEDWWLFSKVGVRSAEEDALADLQRYVEASE